jgi:hypothetical protein
MLSASGGQKSHLYLEKSPVFSLICKGPIETPVLKALGFSEFSWYNRIIIRSTQHCGEGLKSKLLGRHTGGLQAQEFQVFRETLQ